MSADNAQAIAFPKLQSQQFLFSNIIKVYEEDVEIPQLAQNLFTDEKPDLLVSELSHILSSLESNQSAGTNDVLNEVPKLINEKEITGKEYIFDNTTVKELITKIRGLLDANKDLSLEVKKIPLNSKSPIKGDSINEENSLDKMNSTKINLSNEFSAPTSNSEMELALPIAKNSEKSDVSKTNLSKKLSLSEDIKAVEKNVTKTDAEPDYSFEIKIKTESKEVLVTIIPNNLNDKSIIKNPQSTNESIPLVQNENEESGNIPNLIFDTEEKADKYNEFVKTNKESYSSINKPLATYAETGYINESSDPDSEPVLNVKKSSVPSSEPVLDVNTSSVSSSEPVLDIKKPSVSNSEPFIMGKKTSLPNSGHNRFDNAPEVENNNYSSSEIKGVFGTNNTINSEIISNSNLKVEISQQINVAPSGPESLDTTIKNEDVNIDEDNSGYFEAPVKQSKQSPIELAMPKKHFSVRVQDTSEKINLESQKVSNNVETELHNSKLPVDVEVINDSEASKKIFTSESTINSNNFDNTSKKINQSDNIITETKGANIEVEPKTQIEKENISSENKNEIKIVDVSTSNRKTKTTKVESKVEKVVIPNLAESEKSISDNVLEPKINKETIVSEKSVDADGVYSKSKFVAKPENTIPQKEHLKAEIPAPAKESVKIKSTIKEDLSIENKATSNQIESSKTTVQHKERLEVNKISEPIPSEKVKYSKEINETIPEDKIQSNIKESAAKEVKESLSERDYKVKIEVKSMSESNSPKIVKSTNIPAKEFEVFELSGMMKSLKSDTNKEIKTEETIKIEKETTISNTKKVTESETKADTGSKNEFSDKNLQQFTKNTTIDRVEAPKEKIFSELHNMQDSIRLIKSNEIVKEMNKILARPETQSMTFQVTPDELGKIKLVIDLIENHVSAKIEVESEQVRQIVQNNIEQLKSSIQSSGVQVSSLNVSLNYNEQKAGKNAFGKKKNSLNENNFEIEDAKEDNSRKKMGYSTVEFLA
jgi:flagellar hook-length control protein FliK